jgi:hypothetical protein
MILLDFSLVLLFFYFNLILDDKCIFIYKLTRDFNILVFSYTFQSPWTALLKFKKVNRFF